MGEVLLLLMNFSVAGVAHSMGVKEVDLTRMRVGLLTIMC